MDKEKKKRTTLGTVCTAMGVDPYGTGGTCPLSAILDFKILKFLVYGHIASPYQIPPKSVKRLQRYRM